MTWPQPTRQFHQKLCLAEDWNPVRDACGRTGTHHVTYELSPEVPSEALPSELVHLLLSPVGLDEAAVAAMTKDEAVARLNRYWTDGS